jgi:hypothetical protein
MTTNQNGAQSATKTPSRPGEFSEQLDPGLMQHEIYRQFVERFVEVADETSLTAADQLGMRLVIYNALSDQGRDNLRLQVPFNPGKSADTTNALISWLRSFDEAQVAFMTRLAIADNIEAMSPGSPTATVLNEIAGSIGVDPKAIEAGEIWEFPSC